MVDRRKRQFAAPCPVYLRKRGPIGGVGTFAGLARPRRHARDPGAQRIEPLVLRGDMYGYSAHVIRQNFDFTGMQSGSDVQTKAAHAVADSFRAPDSWPGR